jgi:antitoxin MazE
MTQSIRRIGNSQGVILPRVLLQQAGIANEVTMEVIDGAIVLKAAKNHPRAGWDEEFQKAEAAGHVPDADMFEGMSAEFDETEWTW